MNVQCKAVTGLLAAGIAVTAAPAWASAANQSVRPSPAAGSAAGPFAPAAQPAPLRIPGPPSPAYLRPEPANLTVSVTPGKGAGRPNPPQCDSLLVTVTGANFPGSLDSGELYFSNAAGQVVDYWYYTWSPTGPNIQTLGTLAADWLAPTAEGVTDLRVAVAGDAGLSRSFTVDCAN